MRIPSHLYRHSLALLTDFYQLTMAYAYFRAGVADREAVFHLFFRKHPFGGGFTVAAGLAHLADWLETCRFTDDDLSYLGEQRGADGRPLFEPAFLEHLKRLQFALDVDAMPEGTVVFPHEPLLRVRGPIIPAQLVETMLLNTINFQSLVATKAARIVQAARGAPVIEFGLRRAQGMDGALAASRAAYIGGCTATSNTLAGRVYGIPVRGTHAHSWVMLWDDERAAFDAYAEVLPGNCVFLVDTYNTLDGVRHATESAAGLRARGHEMVGVRLDSGDLAYLSIEARKILDAAGFPKASILASNDLDEHIIASLREQGAKIDAWGVGTKLVTAFDEPALGGVYKLGAVRAPGGDWEYRVKLSEQSTKISTPGILEVRRFLSDRGELRGDVIWDQPHGIPDGCTMVDPFDFTRRKTIPAGTPYEDLLVPIFRAGKRVYQEPSLEALRTRAQGQLARLHPGVRRFMNPHEYPVGLEAGLHERRTKLVMRARGHK